jgi:protein involved in polysaccharide export with SLBB domain
MVNRIKTVISLGFMLGLGTLASYGQIPDMGEAFAYRYAEEGRTTIDVYVWGAVGRPGIWKVASDVDLIELLSVAQVPGVGEVDASIDQTVMLQIYRTQGGRRQTVYSEQLDMILASGQAYPALQEGDIVEVITRRRKRFGLQVVSQLVGTAASLVLLIIRISGR